MAQAVPPEPAPAAAQRLPKAGLALRILRSQLAPLAAWLLAMGLVTAWRWAGDASPVDFLQSGYLLAALALQVGQLGALWHWFLRGSVFLPGVRLGNLLAGASLGAWALLLFEPAQRAALRLALLLARGTPWEGLVTGLTWALLLCGLPLLALGGVLLWRALAQAVLAGRLAASALHDVAWVLSLGGLAAIAQASLGLADALAAPLPGSLWIVTAQRLSLFVDELGPWWLTLCGLYALMRLGVGGWQPRMPVGARLPPLVLIDLRRVAEQATVGLHALACAWGEGRGTVVLVRCKEHAVQHAGAHVRWATVARRLPELFVAGPVAARRWCQAWLAPGAGPWLRECFLASDADLRELAVAINRVAPQALFVLIKGAWPSSGELDRLRLALPKARTRLLTAPGIDGMLMPRVAGVEGNILTLGQRLKLVSTLSDLAQAPPQQLRLGIIGRPRSDRLCDELVALLDQRPLAGGQGRFDAQRPARDAALALDRLLLLVDPAWLAGEPEALAEVAALQPLLQAAADVVVFSVGPSAQTLTQAHLAAALAWCGWSRDFAYCGALPWEPARWLAEGVLDRFVQGERFVLPADTEAAAAATLGVLSDPADEAFVRGPLMDPLTRHLGSAQVARSWNPELPPRALLLVLSPALLSALRSDAAHPIALHVLQALERRAPVLPLWLDGVRLEDERQPVLQRLLTIQALPLRTPPSPADMEQVLHDVTAMLARQAVGAASASPAPLPRDFAYTATISYAIADDKNWNGWVGQFRQELEGSLAAQLRGTRLPPLFMAGEGGPVSGRLSDELASRLAASFALILVVHDNYASSDWCQRELELFVQQHGATALRDRVYVVALSRSAVERVVSSPDWQRLGSGESGDQVWLPFYEADDPDRPQPIYLQTGIVSPAFRVPFERLRSDLATKLRLAGVGAAAKPERPTVESGAADRNVRLYIESNREDRQLWQAIGEKLEHDWDAWQDEWDPSSTLRLRLRTRGLPMDRLDSFPLDDADGVLLLWGRKSAEVLAAQVAKLEHKLAADRGAAGLIVRLDGSDERTEVGSAMNWPVVVFSLEREQQISLAPGDVETVKQFLHRLYRGWRGWSRGTHA